MLPWQVSPPLLPTVELVRVSQRHIKEYREMWLNNGWKCAMCGRPFTSTDGAVVDHCHNSGIIRGCVHNTCNRVEGELRGALSRWEGNPESYIIKVGREPSPGTSLGKNLSRIAKWCHKGVSVSDYIAGLSIYLDWYSVPRTRMVHPNHRFANEGGSDYKKHDAKSRARKGFYRRKRR